MIGLCHIEHVPVLERIAGVHLVPPGEMAEKRRNIHGGQTDRIRIS